MAVTLSSSTKQPAKPKISHWSFRRRLSASLRRAKFAPTKNMSGRRGDTDSPHRGGQAVARVAKIPHSTWPKLSPTTPVHKSVRAHGCSSAVWEKCYKKQSDD